MFEFFPYSTFSSGTRSHIVVIMALWSNLDSPSQFIAFCYPFLYFMLKLLVNFSFFLFFLGISFFLLQDQLLQLLCNANHNNIRFPWTLSAETQNVRRGAHCRSYCDWRVLTAILSSFAKSLPSAFSTFSSSSSLVGSLGPSFRRFSYFAHSFWREAIFLFFFLKEGKDSCDSEE